ncbi:MAG TPA: SsrA-binding protein [Flavobacteriales bacterium]|nr:SsrA-binding protein [Flavobacteriales bacterium]HMR27951.1 SsrA-binding protein [Flavobacteriales bacterium]
MRRAAFRLLARLNKAVLPTLWDKDLTRLSKAQKLLVAWRYWVTRNAL